MGYRRYVDTDVVTGEAVAVETPTAALAPRIGSALIDILVLVALWFSTTWVLGQFELAVSEAVGRTLSLLLVVALLVAYPATVERLTLGRSFGKWVLGLRVVRDDGGPVTARHTIGRALIGVVEVFVSAGVVAVLAALVHPRAKRLGDMAVGTYVISTRIPRPQLASPPMPFALAPWAASADIATLPPGLAIAIRQFLARRESLTPDSRQRVGAELVADTLTRVAPPPPAGTPAEAFLAAVLAERGRRDTWRLDRERALRERVLPVDELEP